MKTDPQDANVLMRIGDLHLKQGAAPQAAEVYVAVSRNFAQAGFEAKAVAVAKQVLRIDPDRLEIRVELGELYQRMGLPSDAVREFQSALELYRERGAKTEVYDLLKRAASLDPENIPNRLSLAGLMIHEGLEGEALAEFDRLLADADAAGAEDALERVATATLEHFPEHVIAQRRLGEAKFKAGDNEEAALLLRAAAQGLPDDLEVRQMLAEVHDAVGDEEAAQQAWTEVAGLYRARGDEDAARDIMQRRVSIATIGAPTRIVQEIELQAGESQPEMEPDLENPDVPDVLETTGSGTALESGLEPQRDSEPRFDSETDFDLDVELDSKTDVDLDPELEPELDSEFDLEPDLDLELELDLAEPAAPETDAGHTAEAARAVPAQVLEPDPEADTHSSMLLSEVVTEDAATDSELDDAEPATSTTLDTEALIAEARVSLEYEQYELAADRARSVLQHDPASDAAREVLSQVLSSQGDARGAVALEQERRLQARAEGDASRMAAIDQRIETLAPSGPDTQSPGTESEAPLGTAPVTSPSGPVSQRVTTPTLGGPASKQQPVGVHATADEATSLELPLIEACEMLEPEADGPPGTAEELVLSTPIDVDDDTESDATQTRASTSSAVEAVFAAFKQGIQSQLEDDESGAHYDLAIAYREMGLVEDAVQELEVARRGEACRLEALSLLASCKLELGCPADAVDHLEEALALAKQDPLALTALRYDLGESLHACSRNREALLAFREVAAADADFREVVTRIRELESLID